MGRNILTFDKVYIEESATVVGKKESAGPLKEYFDVCVEDEYFGMDSFEKAETEMQRQALNLLVGKAGKSFEEIDFVCGGDLVNQCVPSSYAARETKIPFIGLFGACSTMVESAIVASLFVQGGYGENVIAVTSSHFCTAERQFRFPLEYGSQKTPTSQNTVTGSGALLLTSKKSRYRITEALVGSVIDPGVKDANNMGAAMAPAVVNTLTRYFDRSGKTPDDFDLILTGDLGYEGHELSKEIFAKTKYKPGSNYSDCGLLIYDKKEQKMVCGGSGCGCVASVTAGYVIGMMKERKLNDVLIVATGALLNQNSVLQSESIPSIAHLIRIQNTYINENGGL